MIAKPAGGWGVAPVVAGYWAAVGALLYAGLQRSQGRLVYPLDDTYVHMAMAKNMSLHGVWGVTAEQFTSASSSPLWTALLALTYSVVGVSDWAPLVLNLLIGTAVVVSVHRILRESGLTPIAAAAGTIALIFLGTLPTLTMLGMEHTLHVLVTIWFVLLGVRLTSLESGIRDWWPVAALAAVLTVTRYEGAFAVLCVVVVLWLARRRHAGVAIALAGAAPILIYGLWSQANGGFLLPNSVLLKGVTPALTAAGLLQLAVFWPALTALASTPHLAFLLVATLGLAIVVRRESGDQHKAFLALVFAGCTLLHMEFARAGWFYRYETYLVVLGLVTVVVMVADANWGGAWSGRAPAVSALSIVVLVGVLAFPLVRRAVNAFRQTPAAISNIYEQQYQAGLFLDQYYRGRRVAVNDVGAIGYLADVNLLDVWGLASRDTAALKRSGAFTSTALEQLASRDAAEIAIIYPTWLNEFGGVPAAWQKVGEWRVTDNVVLGENGMSFYAVTGAARDALIDNLAKYADRLPPTVVQEGLYRAGH